MDKNIKKKFSQSPTTELARHCGAAIGIAALFTGVLLGVFSLVMSNMNLPFSAHQPLTTISISLASLLALYLVGKQRKKSGLVLGLVSGIGIFALVFILSLIWGDGEYSAQLVVKLIAIVSASGVGGILGVSAANKTKKIKA